MDLTEKYMTKTQNYLLLVMISASISFCLHGAAEAGCTRATSFRYPEAFDRSKQIDKWAQSNFKDWKCDKWTRDKIRNADSGDWYKSGSTYYEYIWARLTYAQKDALQTIWSRDD